MINKEIDLSNKDIGNVITINNEVYIKKSSIKTDTTGNVNFGIMEIEKDLFFPYTVNTNIFIRTVTLYYIGKLIKVKGQWITLSEASWVADTGRFFDFLKDGKCNEYESFQKEVSIPINSIIDVTVWQHGLFKGQK